MKKIVSSSSSECEHASFNAVDADSSALEDRRSALARRVADVKAATLQAAEKRDRLPQPLFWSLFSLRINDIKKEKERARTLTDIFG
jgi:hypothetical protein